MLGNVVLESYSLKVIQLNFNEHLFTVTFTGRSSMAGQSFGCPAFKASFLLSTMRRRKQEVCTLIQSVNLHIYRQQVENYLNSVKNSLKGGTKLQNSVAESVINHGNLYFMRDANNSRDVYPLMGVVLRRYLLWWMKFVTWSCSAKGWDNLSVPVCTYGSATHCRGHLTGV